MKTLSIGDLHGLNVWKTFGDIPQLLTAPFEPEYDKYIFVGDYTDSFSVSNVEILHNLKEIIDFKIKYLDHVILLWGNHDIQYLTSFQEHGCSGFRPEAYWDLHDLFIRNKHLFQLAFQYKNYLWTHAGIHKGWYKYQFPYKSANVADDLNKAFEKNMNCIFDVGYSRGGLQNVGGPLWADKTETWDKPLENFHQIVGHTRIKEMIHRKIDINTSVTYIDCLEDGANTPYILTID